MPKIKQWLGHGYSLHALVWTAGFCPAMVRRLCSKVVRLKKVELASLRTYHGKRPVAFLDRDGVLNVDHGYVYTPDQFEWIASAPEAVRLLNEAGYLVLVVTNQAGIARGYYDEASMHRFHAHMQDSLQTQGAHIDAFYYCPHHPEGSVKELAVQCRCRKPQPGMLEQAAREWPIDLDHSFLIGDKDTDMIAAAAFHIRGIKFDAKNNLLVEIVRRELAGYSVCN